MQSEMQMFVARFASKDPRIVATPDAKRGKTSACGALCVCAARNAGVLQLRFRMTAKNKHRHSPLVLEVSLSLNLQTEVSILL